MHTTERLFPLGMLYFLCNVSKALTTPPFFSQIYYLFKNLCTVNTHRLNRQGFHWSKRKDYLFFSIMKTMAPSGACQACLFADYHKRFGIFSWGSSTVKQNNSMHSIDLSHSGFLIPTPQPRNLGSQGIGTITNLF